MSCLNSYKKRVGSGGVTGIKSRLIADARRNFERSLKNDPSSVVVKITDVGEVNISEDTKLVPCIINDFSENDQKTFDEKVLYVRHNESVGVGSYVEFDGFIWLVIFREHRSTNIYKSFIMRKCNQFINYEYQNEIYSIPCVIKNLTQYSDGLQDIVYTSTPDSRRSILYANNRITSKIELGHRFLVNHKRTYRVTHIQDFEYQDSYGLENGIISCIAVHTALKSEDDTENNIAHNEPTNVVGDSEVLMIGSNLSYNVENDCSWEIEYTSSNKDYINISTDNKTCEISVEFDFDLIGETFTLKALSLNNEIVFKKDITVVGFI